MNIFEIIRGIRKNLAAANHFELLEERKKSADLRERWLAASERESQLLKELREVKRENKWLKEHGVFSATPGGST